MIPLPPRLWSRIAGVACAAMLVSALPVRSSRSQVEPPCGLCAIADRIERDPIEALVRGLSGADSITVGAARLRLATRSTLHPQKDLAREWLLAQVRAIGYEPSLQWFVLNVYHPDHQGAELSTGGDTLLCGDDEGKVYRITAADGWEAGAPLGLIAAHIYDLRRDGQGMLWAACKASGSGYGELHRSLDGGETWTPYLVGGSGNSVFSLRSVSFSGPDAAVAAGSFGTVIVLQRAVGEWFWRRIEPGIFSFRHINGTGTSGPTHLWLAADGGTLFESADLGGTWNARSLTAARLWDVDFNDAQHGVVVGERVAFRTTDGGTTWQQSSVSTTLRTVEMIDSVTAIAGGDGGAIWQTLDGGATWVQLAPACVRTRDVMRVIVGADGRVWAVGRDEALLFDPDDAADCAATVFSDTLRGANIVFSLEGSVHPDRTVVLCSHYDSKSSTDPENAPGADDNASGTAAVLEAARALRSAALERTVDFVFFDGEEIGLLGSRHYVGLLPPYDPGIEGVINLDMLGRDYGGGVRLEIAGRVSSPDTGLVSLVSDVTALLGLDLDPHFLTSRSPTSDHKPFWVLDGVPAIILIEGEYWNNPYYHTASDVAANCDFDYMTGIARAAAVSAAALAGLISSDPLPGTVVLHQNFPNPLWGDTRIRFELPGRMMTELAVYDVTGRRVRTLMRRYAGPGPGEYAWDGTDDSGRDLASGVYFLRLRAGTAERTRKLVIIR